MSVIAVAVAAVIAALPGTHSLVSSNKDKPTQIRGDELVTLPVGLSPGESAAFCLRIRDWKGRGTLWIESSAFGLQWRVDHAFYDLWLADAEPDPVFSCWNSEFTKDRVFRLRMKIDHVDLSVDSADLVSAESTESNLAD